jgi:2'-5' RNA ligase
VNGIFIISELAGPAREQIRAVHAACDPRLAASSVPHVTIAGSSGVGPIPLDTPLAELRRALEPVAAETPPITVRLRRPERFMQTDIVVLPIDPHGPLRALHERIARSGLTFLPTRFTFTPHVTLSFYPTLTPELRRRLLGVRVEGPVLLDRIQLYRTVEPMPGRKVLELALGGGGSGVSRADPSIQ